MSSVIQTENLNVIFDETIALSNVNLNIEENDYAAIIGPNGGGKTTLLRSLLGLQQLSSGKVLLYAKEPRQSRTKVGFVPQFAKINKRFPMTVFEAVLTGALKGSFHPFFKYSDTDKEKAMEQLKRLGIEKLYKRQLSDLSGGEFQRLLIARALLNEPSMLMLDEPTSSIDPKSREFIYELLAELNKVTTILMVSHDLVAISSNVKSVICLNKSLIYHGEVSLSSKTVSELYGCSIDLIAHGVPHRVLPLHKHEGDCSHD